MVPWYRGFKGKVEWVNAKSHYKLTGIWRRVDDTTLEITELPASVWMVNYKKFIEGLLGETDASKTAAKAGKSTKANTAKTKAAAAKTKVAKAGAAKPGKKSEEDSTPLIEDYKDYCTESRVRFVITCKKLKKLSDEEVEKKFKLSKSIKISNMHLFDADGKIQKYGSPEDILKDFFKLRLRYYIKRKEHLVSELTKDWKKLENKVRFILAVIAEQMIVRNRKKKGYHKRFVKCRVRSFS